MIVTVALRVVTDLFAAAVITIELVPLVDDVLSRVSHDASLDAVQSQFEITVVKVEDSSTAGPQDSISVVIDAGI